ncbi:MAG: hypothetical protein ACXWP5_00170 [Bdellovibrionota bacterium]
MQSETRTNLSKVNRDLTDSGKAFTDFTNGIKKQASSMIGSIEEAGKSFAKNLGRGALAGGALIGIDAMRDGMKEAVKTGLSFDDALARVASRADLSAKQVAKLKQEFFELGKTGAKLESIPEAFNAIYGATGNVDQSKSVMEPIAKAAAMGNGDAGQVAEFVKDRLKGEGKDINKGNVQELLQSLVLAQRGGEFNSMQDAMQGMGGIDAVSQKRAGLSDRDLAGLMAGATRAGTNKATGIAGVQGLLQLATGGLSSDAALSGMLGVKGGSLMRDGKFDMNALLSAPGLSGKHFGEADKAKLMGDAGLSGDQATGVLAFLQNAQKFRDGMKKVATDTKTFEQSFEETTDTLGHRLEELKNTTVGGFSDIFSPLMGIAKQAAGGHIGDALSNLPRAVGEMGAGAAAHPLLTGGALLATAAGGALLKKFGLGGGGELAKGVATGTALKQAGVTPVYVTNAGEISGAGGNSMADKFMQGEDKLGGLAGGAAGMGKLAKVMNIAKGVAGVGAAGALGYEVGTGINNVIDEKTQGKTSEGFEGNAVERLIFKLDKLFGGENAKNIIGANKMTIEIDSKDAAYMARPKKTDNARNPTGF